MFSFLLLADFKSIFRLHCLLNSCIFSARIFLPQLDPANVVIQLFLDGHHHKPLSKSAMIPALPGVPGPWVGVSGEPGCSPHSGSGPLEALEAVSAPFVFVVWLLPAFLLPGCFVQSSGVQVIETCIAAGYKWACAAERFKGWSVLLLLAACLLLCHLQT